MEPSAKNVVVRALESFRDLERYLEFYSENVVIHELAEHGLAGVEGARFLYGSMLKAFPDLTLELKEVVAEENVVACRFVIRGTHTHDFAGIEARGRPVEFEVHGLYRIVDGKCVEQTTLSDVLALLHQTGSYRSGFVLPEGSEFAPSQPRAFFPLEVRESSLGLGKGVFATEPIRKDSVVFADGGDVVTSNADAGGPWSMLIAEGVYLAPRDYQAIPKTWYLNHSCASNVARLGGLVYVARRNIPVGEELTIDYAGMLGEGISLQCRCQQPSCRTVVTGGDWRVPAVARALWSEWLPHIQRKILDHRILAD